MLLHINLFILSPLLSLTLFISITPICFIWALQNTCAHTKAHVSIHSCRAVRSNLDSRFEWIVMQRGGRGAQTGCRRAAAHVCPTCLFLPCGGQRRTISPLQVFLVFFPPSPLKQTTIVTVPLLVFLCSAPFPGVLKQNTVLGDYSLWSNNVNTDTWSLHMSLEALELYANASRSFALHQMWSCTSCQPRPNLIFNNPLKFRYVFRQTWKMHM